MKPSSIFIVLLLVNGNSMTIHASTHQAHRSLFANIPTTVDQLIDHGASNISAGYHKILPTVNHRQLLESNVFTYSHIQTALGAGQIIAGTLEIVAAKTVQKIYTNPKETMASIIIPMMIQCMMHQSETSCLNENPDSQLQ